LKPILRWLLVGCVLSVLIGAGFAIHAFLNRQISFRVAVTSLDSDDAGLVTALNRWFSANGRRYRLRTVVVEDRAAGMQAVIDRKADFVALRTDETPPAQLASLIVLYKEVAFFVGLPQAGVSTLAQLRGKTIGVTGKTALDDPLLKTMLRLQGVADAKLVALPAAQIRGELQKRSVQAIAHVGPVNGNVGQELRAMRPLRKMKGGEPVLLELDDAETIVTLNRQYEDFDVPAGAIRAQPSLPPETLSTLAVARHLMGRRNTPNFAVQRFLSDMVDARRGILGDYPLAVQMGAPDTEPNAVMPVHTGAVAFFDNEQVDISSVVSEWGYLILAVLGGLGTGIVALVHWLWPKEEPSALPLAVSFLKLKREASSANSAETLPGLEAQLRDLLTQMGEMFEEGEVPRDEIHAVLVTAEMAERRVAEARARVST
jgi:uncharacterized protein